MQTYDSLKNTEVFENMNVKKAIKKVVALAAGATIVGATLAGAMATLEEYPAPFVSDGVWADSVIVIGQSAATTDVIGAIEIAASLQAAAVTETEIDIEGTVDVTIDEGKKIEKSGNKFNYGDDAEDIQAVFDDVDLPDLLADGEFEKEDYTQTLTLSTGSAVFAY
jgi:hypothetical protein